MSLSMAMFAAVFVVSRGAGRWWGPRATVAAGTSAARALGAAQLIAHLVEPPRPEGPGL